MNHYILVFFFCTLFFWLVAIFALKLLLRDSDAFCTVCKKAHWYGMLMISAFLITIQLVSLVISETLCIDAKIIMLTISVYPCVVTILGVHFSAFVQ